MSFHEVRFPASLSFGSSGGPERRTEIVTLANGFEERNTPWSASRHRYDAGLGMRALEDIETLIGFFEARQGRLIGFRWKDWSDYKSCAPKEEVGLDDQLLGTGDGVQTVFQLQKVYMSGGTSYAREIRKPVDGTVLIGQGGALAEEATVDATTGAVTFPNPPAPGVQVTAGFEFDVPVRFDTDQITTSMASFQAGEVPSVPIVEVRI